MIIHFLVSGHTKFSPDRMFGWISNLIKKGDLFSPEDIAEWININHSNSYSAWLCKKNLIKDWTPYIRNYYNKVQNITKLHLIIIERNDDKITTKSKYHSNDRAWINIEHIKTNKLKTFQLRTIAHHSIPQQLWNGLSQMSSYIHDQKKFKRLENFLKQYKPLQTQTTTKSTKNTINRK